MQDEEKYVRDAFNDFLENGKLPEEIPREVMGFDFGNKEWNATLHYFTHVVSDSDIRAKEPELDAFMRRQLREMIRAL